MVEGGGLSLAPGGLVSARSFQAGKEGGAGGEDRTPDLRFTKPLHYRCATPAPVTPERGACLALARFARGEGGHQEAIFRRVVLRGKFIATGPARRRRFSVRSDG